ncbi:glycogen synthase [Spelaeicoccus albus]|uniref:D-inositol 3-phosphate glycosyltransferase n=1 Tax=Spelaeicoccus albus TaxID=1280376 RepID=A0A7Z0D1C6_9MICO|nr:glycogen synthase [Spelaeicoccus albus]NYI66027.1 starch synthase [Spelaeicoccus albus]
MHVGLLTREFPPAIYGGAGVHVDFLSRHLQSLVDLRVLCMGDARPDDGRDVRAFAERDPRFSKANSALNVLSTDLEMTAACNGLDLVHSHTWYANMAGHLSKLLYGIPHVVSAHSLEPLRPWKAEQLGGGYALSSWAERTAYLAADAVIAVSEGMARDIRSAYPEIPADRLHVIYNGIDADFYHPDAADDVPRSLGIDPERPYVTFVGRITRQKGVPHLLRAAKRFDPAVQILLLAGAADTPELKAETDALIDELQSSRDGVVVVSEMLPRESVRQVLTHALAFLCPSVYEPLGIVNLEAMACETAVVASAVGGIPEVVADGETGYLVDYDPDAPSGLEAGLADRVNRLAADPNLAHRFGVAGRKRAVENFDWAAIARQTADLYAALL